MNVKKMKLVLVICLVIIVSLFALLNQRSKRQSEKYNESVITSVNIDDVYMNISRDEINYDNPSEQEREYLLKKYGDTVAFTKKGTEIYYEKAFSGPVSKIITSTWPQTEIVSLIPQVDFGTLTRIEYTEKFLRVYLSEVKSSDISSYVKALKKENYTQASQKIESDSMLRYNFKNEEGNQVTVTYYKRTKTAEIYLKP